MTLRWHALAQAELDEATDYYLINAEAGVSRKFANAVVKALELISTHSAIGAATHHRARRLPRRGFPFDLVYRADRQGLIIIALANQYHRPGYWAGRR
jgi:plasmid stabilization system protein ParE